MKKWGKKHFESQILLRTTIKLNWAVDQLITSFRPQPLKAQIFTKMWGQCHFLSVIHAVITSWWQRNQSVLSHHSHHCCWGWTLQDSHFQLLRRSWGLWDKSSGRSKKIAPALSRRIRLAVHQNTGGSWFQVHFHNHQMESAREGF